MGDIWSKFTIVFITLSSLQFFGELFTFILFLKFKMHMILDISSNIDNYIMFVRYQIEKEITQGSERNCSLLHSIKIAFSGGDIIAAFSNFTPLKESRLEWRLLQQPRLLSCSSAPGCCCCSHLASPSLPLQFYLFWVVASMWTMWGTVDAIVSFWHQNWRFGQRYIQARYYHFSAIS